MNDISRIIDQFKERSRANIQLLIDSLIQVTQLNDNHFSRTALSPCIFTTADFVLDREKLSGVVETIFAQGAPFVINMDERFYGGYPSPNIPVFKNSSFATEVEQNRMWFLYEQNLHKVYWDDPANEVKFQKYKSIALFEEREPKNTREKLLRQQADTGGLGHYQFFNKKKCLLMLDQLILESFPFLKFIKECSSEKVRRYGLSVSDDYYLGLYLDTEAFVKELSLGYLKIPLIKIELFSKYLDKNIKEELYLVQPSEYAIIRFDLYYIFGKPFSLRISEGLGKSEEIKKKWVFTMNVYAYYLDKYFKFIETIIKGMDPSYINLST